MSPEEALEERARQAAYRYLGYRPRSEAEMRRRLCRRFSSDLVEVVLRYLKEQRLVDDAAFARFWKENRETFGPRSRRLLWHELRAKGVPEAVVTVALEEVNDEESAYQAGQKKAARLVAASFEDFKRQLASFLQRRGFTYATIVTIVHRLWQDRESQAAAPPGQKLDKRGLR